MYSAAKILIFPVFFHLTTSFYYICKAMKRFSTLLRLISAVFLTLLLQGCASDDVEIITPETDPVRYKEVPLSYQIPTVKIYTDRRAQIRSKDEWVGATFSFTDPSCYFSPVKNYTGKGRIKGRGNTTWNMPKKPWHIKLDEKVSIFGDWPNRDWVLLANYSDKSLLRNMTAMEISRICSMAWTPTMISVEVYLNNEYVGVYSFSEHKEVARHRVNIEPAAPGVVDGGYYMEVEANKDEPVYFVTGAGACINFHEPEYPDEKQVGFVSQWFKDFEKALYDKDAPKGKAWWDYFDISSLVNYYIIEEICRDPDGGIFKSTFITKEAGKPLEMYHVWDFDITLGNCNYTGNFANPKGWHMRNARWYRQLFSYPEFRQAVKKQWRKVYPGLKKVPDFIDRQYRMVNEASERNFQKWNILGRKVWPNEYAFESYIEEVMFLKEFYSKRIEWMDKQINSPSF